MLTYENVLDRARREVLDETTREVYLAEFVDGIRWYPETSRLLPPEHLNDVVDAVVRAQRAGLSLGAIVNERHGFYPLVAKLATRRMTLTLPVINAAHNVTFLIVGDDKARILRTVLDGPADPPLPAQLVTVPSGRRIFFVDRPASALLGSSAATGTRPGVAGRSKSREGGR